MGRDVAIIDGPFLTFRAWNTAGTSDAMLASSVQLVAYYFKRNLDVWIVWEQPGGRGLDFRRKIDPGYKARRGPKPPDYLECLDELQRALPGLGVAQAWPKEGEADDAAATLAWRHRRRDDNVELWALDHDWLQLVAPGLSVRQPAKPPRTVTSANIVELTGGDAAWQVNQMSLCGDTGDDIPGLPRIGKERARRLLELCPSMVQDLLDCPHTDLAEAGKAVERSVAAGAPQMLRWAQVAIDNVELLRSTRELVTLRDVPLMEVPAAGDPEAATAWLQRHGLQRHVETIRERLDPDPWLVDDDDRDVPLWETDREPWE